MSTPIPPVPMIAMLDTNFIVYTIPDTLVHDEESFSRTVQSEYNGRASVIPTDRADLYAQAVIVARANLQRSGVPSTPIPGRAYCLAVPSPHPGVMGVLHVRLVFVRPQDDHLH